jgi:hypothetical protein
MQSFFYRPLMSHDLCKVASKLHKILFVQIIIWYNKCLNCDWTKMIDLFLFVKCLEYFLPVICLFSV